MTYEEYLDEVTTLIVEKYGVSDAAAIKMVVEAQDKEFFVRHDDDKKLRNEDQAHLDANTIYTAASKGAGAAKPAARQATKSATQSPTKPATKQATARAVEPAAAKPYGKPAGATGAARRTQGKPAAKGPARGGKR